MKRFSLLATTLVAILFAASCQHENLEPTQTGSTVTFSVQVPDVATKAVTDDGSNIDNLVYAVYRTTGIDEADVYTSLTEDKLVYQDNVENPTEPKFIVPLELINDQDYVVLFWAQVGNTWIANDHAFGTEGITYPDNDATKTGIQLDGNADKYAAFSGRVYLPGVDGSSNKSTTLKRAVAQVNVATTLPYNYTVELEKSNVTVAGVGENFSVAKQKATGNIDVVFSDAVVPDGTITVSSTAYDYAAMNYMFANGNVEVTYNIATKNHGTVNNTVHAVPVEANYRTNIVGNLLTSDVEYSVTLDEWADYIYQVGDASVSTADDFLNAFENLIPGVPANITLEGDIDLSEPHASAGLLSTKAGDGPQGITIPAGSSVILDLNGYTLKQEVECTGSYSMIVNNGTLTVTGNGKVSFKDLSAGGGSTWGSYTIENHGTLTVENGTIEHLGDASLKNNTNIPIQNYAGKVVVNDGIISSPTFRSLRDFTAGGEIIINGGQFLGQVWMQGLGTGSSSLTINGGEFNPTAGYDGSSVYITNGANDVIVSITGGTFNTKIGCADSTKSGVKGCVTGGQFKVDPSNYVADGCYALKYDDEEYYRIYDNFDPANRTYTVNSKEELLRLSDLSAKWDDFFSNGEGTQYSNYAEQNGGKGVDFYYDWTWTIKLTVDIDFEGETIEPINLGKRKCFDGQGHTIKNAKIETSSDAGLFNAAQCGLKNLVIENVQVKTSDNGATAGILASSCNAGVENITINNSSVYGGKYTGAVVGYGYTDVTNCSVTDCTVRGCYKCGGIIGYICASNDQTRKVDNNTLTGCTVDFTGTFTAGKTEFVCGMVVGNYNCNGTCSNNTIDNMTTVATGLIGKVEAGKNVTVTGTDFKVATTDALQAALDNATEGTTITLVPNVNYGLVYMGRPTKHNATVMACSTHEYTTTNAVAFKNHLSDGAYHTTPKYTTTLKNLTVVGAEGAKIAGLLATSGHMYGDNVYDHVLDVTKNGSGYYNTLNLRNVLFSNVDFTGKIDINTSDATSVYDGVTFDGCTFTTGGIASSNGASIRYYNEANNGNVKNIVVKNCSFTYSYQGVYVQNVNGVTVTDSKFDTTGHNAIAVQSTSEPVNMKNIVIKANNFKNINDRVIRFGEIGADSNITIQNNTAVNSGDEDGEVMKAVSIAAGITTSISGNNWGEGKVVANDELKDK